jgi:hypothetical protein
VELLEVLRLWDLGEEWFEELDLGRFTGPAD